MERTLLLIFILAVIGVGIFAGVGGLAIALHPQASQMTYTTIDGDCKIRVYDDPLYAAHWAKEVNPYNCQAYKTQEEANNIKANTRRVNTETNNMVTAVYSIFVVVALTLVLLAFTIFRG
jgi:hypothetical protein